MSKMIEEFAENVFSDKVMKERLTAEDYRQYQNYVKTDTPLTPELAAAVAEQMKTWAIEHGATHFSHWFQPLTGVTAEKHDSFLDKNAAGEPILKFSSKSLIKGEPDASSFPSGGLRATFEARGYTAWDSSSFAFVKDGTLYIPTAFCSYGGEALDKKTPLLRSMDAVNREAKKLLSLFGKIPSRVVTTVGCEQEYFLVDKAVYEKRLDLKTTGRTLFGAKPPKGQELDDHYFGKIKPRVATFMAELDEELWKLGIYAKTKHNEVAPAQHELATIYEEANIACDQNQVVMATMKSVADKNGMVCLLQEKPFEGINGSGKHNNWSLAADGANLLEPGDTPSANLQFLLILAAIVRGVDKHQDLLRYSVASAGNDHRLGANEAPPAVVSMFLGDELTNVLKAISTNAVYADKQKEKFSLGANALPKVYKDLTDRNRTSPFAFTGDKFEFRMVGSMQSVAGVNIVLNTLAAESFSDFYDKLVGAENFNEAVVKLVHDTYIKHKRIIYNGNNYSDEWLAEAQNRGLLNLKTTADAVEWFVKKPNIDLFGKLGVFSKTEMLSRAEVKLEAYEKQIGIECETMKTMTDKLIVPAVVEYKKTVAGELTKLVGLGCMTSLEKDLLDKLCVLSEKLKDKKIALERAQAKFISLTSVDDKAAFCRDILLGTMAELRAVVDGLESIVGKTYWLMPDIADVLSSVEE